MNIRITDNKKTRRNAIKNNIVNAGVNGLFIKYANQAFEGDLNGCQIASGFGEYCNTCTLEVNYYSICVPFILFIHTSNKCFYRFVAKFLESKTPCWIVCYSGGDAADAHAYKALKEKYPSKENIIFSPHISPSVSSEVLNQKWDINAFVEAVIKNQPNPFGYLERKGTPYLTALSILCQGYLAAHEEISLLTNLGKLKGTATSKVGITEDANWWLLVISGNTKSVRDELGDRKNKKAVEALLDAIDGKDEKSLSGGDGIRIVKSAYRVLPEILQGLHN